MDNLRTALNVGVLYRQSQAFVVYACRELGVTYTEYMILVLLSQGDGISQDDISTALVLDKAAVARAIRVLEDKGYIRREMDKNDRRIKRIFFTEGSGAKRELVKNTLLRWVNYLADGVEGQDREVIMNGINTISERARRADFGLVERQEI